VKLALIGYGAMGKLIHRLAEEKGHDVAVIVDEDDARLPAGELAEKLRGVDAAIDFTTAAAVERNVQACVLAGAPVVEGTTGWGDRRTRIEQIVLDGGGAMVYGANFSVGLNLFYRMVEEAARLVAGASGYEAFIEERHHSRKKDAPSGTALEMKKIVAEHFGDGFSVTSTRAGNIPGTHTAGFDGPADQISLTHTARSREGFAAGAIFAAEWIFGRSGVFDFQAVIGGQNREQ
jgi:4-hydroxy-tetrahydrodipicolinate reductase